MPQMSPDDDFIVLSQHVRKNIKTGQEELEMALFDIQATDEDGAVVTITAKDYEVNRRVAQKHEVDQATRTIEDRLKGSWIEQLAQSD